MSADPPVGLAQSQSAQIDDRLVTMLDLARRQGGRGTLVSRRKLWRFCFSAFREWSGLQLTNDPPIVEVPALTHTELADLLQLAASMPAVIRDLLKMHRVSRVTKRKLTLLRQEWSGDREAMLVELHQLALNGANSELKKAQDALSLAEQDHSRGNRDSAIAQRTRMVVAQVRIVDALTSQLHTLSMRS